jgi:dihydropteroate synthase
VAKAALDHGVEIINDPSGHTLDPNLVRTAAQYDAGVVINHMRGTPDTWAKLSPMKDAMAVIVGDLGAAVHRARHVGVDRSRIVLDPGLGFGKSPEGNLQILRELPTLRSAGRPILIGASRKSFIGATLNLPVGERLEGSLAVAALAVWQGAHVIRTHDVAATVRVVRMIDAIRNL